MGDQHPTPAILLHSLSILINVKLTSAADFLFWRRLVVPTFSSYNLYKYLDGSLMPPPETVTTGDKSDPNPAYASWHAMDQKVLCLLLSTLSVDALSEVIDCPTARSAWLALHAVFSNTSTSRISQLRQELSSMKSSSSSVEDYNKQFRTLCDQLVAVGRPDSDDHKAHWFLAGLGPQFVAFCTDVTRSNSQPSRFDATGEEF